MGPRCQQPCQGFSDLDATPDTQQSIYSTCIRILTRTTTILYDLGLYYTPLPIATTPQPPFGSPLRSPCMNPKLTPTSFVLSLCQSFSGTSTPLTCFEQKQSITCICAAASFRKTSTISLWFLFSSPFGSLPLSLCLLLFVLP